MGQNAVSLKLSSSPCHASTCHLIPYFRMPAYAEVKACHFVDHNRVMQVCKLPCITKVWTKTERKHNNTRIYEPSGPSGLHRHSIWSWLINSWPQFLKSTLTLTILSLKNINFHLNHFECASHNCDLQHRIPGMHKFVRRNFYISWFEMTIPFSWNYILLSRFSQWWNHLNIDSVKVIET